MFYQSLVIGNDAELKKDNIIKNITHKCEENNQLLNLENLLEQNPRVNVIFKWDMLKKDTLKNNLRLLKSYKNGHQLYKVEIILQMKQML